MSGRRPFRDLIRDWSPERLARARRLALELMDDAPAEPSPVIPDEDPQQHEPDFTPHDPALPIRRYSLG